MGIRGFVETVLKVGSGLVLGTLGLHQVSRLEVEGCGRLLHLHTKVIYVFVTCSNLVIVGHGYPLKQSSFRSLQNNGLPNNEMGCPRIRAYFGNPYHTDSANLGYVW